MGYKNFTFERPMQEFDEYLMVYKYTSLGGLLKWARKHHGYTLEEVAKEIGSSKSYIHELENDKSEPGLSIIKGLCNLYKLDPRDVIEYGA